MAVNGVEERLTVRGHVERHKATKSKTFMFALQVEEAAQVKPQSGLHLDSTSTFFIPETG